MNKKQLQPRFAGIVLTAQNYGRTTSGAEEEVIYSEAVNLKGDSV